MELSSLPTASPWRQTLVLVLSQGVEGGVKGRRPPKGGKAWISHLPLAESFLVLMILAAYSWPASTFTHLRTTEKAPLGGQRSQRG